MALFRVRGIDYQGRALTFVVLAKSAEGAKVKAEGLGMKGIRISAWPEFEDMRCTLRHRSPRATASEVSQRCFAFEYAPTQASTHGRGNPAFASGQAPYFLRP